MKKYIKNIDKKLFLATVILFVWGLIMIYSASNVTAYMRYEADPSNFFVRQLIFLVAGFFLTVIFVLRYPTKRYAIASWIFLIILSAILVGLLVYGQAVNDSVSWIGYKGFGIQPSEFTKVIMVVWIGTYYSLTKNSYDNNVKMWIPLVVMIFITGCIALQNDYGTALIFMALSLFVFFISPTSKKIKLNVFIFGLIAVASIGLLVFVGGEKIISSDKLARFNFINPCDRYLDSGNQVCNGYIAINNGGLFGKGLGNSTQKYLYLPEAHTDFIFAIIVEELGVIGGVILLLLLLFVIIRIINTGKRATKDSHALICYGIAMYIFLHIIINLGGVLGLIPLTGIPLPFMSYGGSYCWSMMLALTIVQRINYEINIKKA